VVPLKVGLVGAGPWAGMVHAPTLAAGPETELAGIWARRPEAAAGLAERFGVPTFDRYEALLHACEAVAFAVPPDVQAAMAPLAAAAGKALLLEKPIALDLEGAERLRDAVGAAGVGSLVVLTYRFSPPVRGFLAEASRIRGVGGRAWFLSGALLGGWFSTPWRLERGALPDLGPHMIDLLDAALGTVTGVRAHGDSLRWVGLLLEHHGGACSEVSLSGSVCPDARRAGADVFSAEEAATIDTAASVGPDTFATLRAEFAEVARAGASHPLARTLGVERGLHLQRVLADAESQLAR